MGKGCVITDYGFVVSQRLERWDQRLAQLIKALNTRAYISRTYKKPVQLKHPSSSRPSGNGRQTQENLQKLTDQPPGLYDSKETLSSTKWTDKGRHTEAIL